MTMDHEGGHANATASDGVEVITDGTCLQGTLSNIGSGPKGLNAEGIKKAHRDATALLADVVRSYNAEVAVGEVGAGGTGRASDTAAVKRCPTGLLYGRVQSGKTVAMICFTAAALDNGFRVVVVLTSDFVKLVEQTAHRFGALNDALIRSSLQSDTWEADVEHVRKHVASNGVVFICAKNQQRLATLVDFLRKIGAENYPALVLDDEADQATLDTTTAARTSGKANAPTKGSAIHRKTVLNDAPSEEGQSIRETLRHHVFLQVTATPYALLLQNIDNPLRPSFSRLLEPGEGYTGGESFFSEDHIEDQTPPLMYVREDESAEILAPAREAPLGLQQAVAFFLVSSAAHLFKDPDTARSGQNFLCHTSHRQLDHDHLAGLIRDFLSRVGDELAPGALAGEGTVRLHWAYDELKKTVDGLPEFDVLIDTIRRRLPRRDVLIINSATSNVQFGREMNFLVGGNILGRGLTIESLLVTYYLRKAKISQMDTVLQHARMYGYRRRLMPFTRVFLPEDLALKFHHIHNAEQSLRSQLVATSPSSPLAVQTLQNLRATRLNVLDTGSLSAFGPGEQVYPARVSTDRKNFDKIAEKLADAFGGSLREDDFVEAPTSVLVDLVRLAPYDEESSPRWAPSAMLQLLEVLTARNGGKGIVYYRKMHRDKKSFTNRSGALSGAKVKEARGKGVPVLCLFKTTFKGEDGVEYWYPTLVLPENMPNQVFNISE
jgi:hypothetical protein